MPINAPPISIPIQISPPPTAHLGLSCSREPQSHISAHSNAASTAPRGFLQGALNTLTTCKAAAPRCVSAMLSGARRTAENFIWESKQSIRRLGRVALRRGRGGGVIPFIVIAVLLIYAFSNALPSVAASSSSSLAFGGGEGRRARANAAVAEERRRVEGRRDEQRRRLQRGDVALLRPDERTGALSGDAQRSGGEKGEGDVIDVAFDLIRLREGLRRRFGPDGAAGAERNNVVALQNALLETCPLSKALAQRHWATCRIVAMNAYSLQQQHVKGDGPDKSLRALVRANQRASAEVVVREATAIVGRIAAEKSFLSSEGLTPPSAAKVPSVVERLWEECSWDSMAPIHRALWAVMGFGPSAWDSGRAAVPPSDMPFSSLNYAMQQAAQCLGYSEATW